MKFAICNETFDRWPFDKAFAQARECGYTGIEIAPFTLAPDAEPFDAKNISTAQREEVRRQADHAGLAIVGLHWLLAKTEGYHLTSPDAEVRRATADYLAELARLCGDLDGSILVFGSPQQRNLLPGVSEDEAMQYAAEVFRSVMPVFQEHNVTLAVEPLSPAEGDFLNTAADAVRLVEMVDSPNCRLHLDTRAMSSESLPVADVIRGHHEHMVHFHANDASGLGPGMGETDFVPIFGALRAIDYNGWVSVEVFDLGPGPERIARDSIRTMQEVLAKIRCEKT